MALFRGPQASVHDQGQRFAAPHVRHLLPHHLTPQGRLRHRQHPTSAH